MAGLMTAPMVIIELALMGAMYENKKFNAVSDRQFLKSMIPHHAGAILMCEEAVIREAEIKKLCGAIIASQRSEIEQMKAKLNALDRGA